MMVEERSQLYLLYSSWLSLAGVTLHGCSQSQAAEAVILYELGLETLFILFVCFMLSCMHICVQSV